MSEQESDLFSPSSLTSTYNSYQSISITKYDISSGALLSGKTLDVSSHTKANEAISILDTGITKLSEIRSYYGAVQNRLEHTIANVDNTSENLQMAESKIRDLDMAQEMIVLAKNNILLQAGQAVLAQGNRRNEGVLRLIE